MWFELICVVTVLGRALAQNEVEYQENHTRKAFTIARPAQTTLNFTSTLDSRHFDGDDASLYSAPWVVSLKIEIHAGDNKGLYHRCCATVIEASTLITSKQCVTNLPKLSQLLIIAGIKNLMQYHSPDFQIRYPREIILYPNGHDLAIIKLKVPLNYSNTVQPINLPPLDFYMRKNFSAFQFGWSVTSKSEYFSELQSSERVIATNGSCAAVQEQLKGEHICAAGNRCNTGDHGAPLVIFDDSGIANFIAIWNYDICEEDSVVSIFTTITDSLTWLKGMMVKTW